MTVGPKDRGKIGRVTVQVIVVLSLFATIGIVLADRTPAGAGIEQTEADFVVAINRLRVERGMNPLDVDRELTSAARNWADDMATVGDISHAPSITVGITQDWLKVGENVGMGGDVPALMDAFVASPTHYANLIDPVYTHVGVGVVRIGGTIFTAHRFMHLAPPTPTNPPGTVAL